MDKRKKKKESSCHALRGHQQVTVLRFKSKSGEAGRLTRDILRPYPPQFWCLLMLSPVWSSQWGLLGFSSVQFSHSVMSDSLQPYESQHARPPCPSPTPGVHSDSRPSSQRCHSAISSCCPLLLLLPIPPSIRVFSNESTETRVFSYLEDMIRPFDTGLEL